MAKEHRDEAISRALAELPLPPESPTFFDDLREQALAEGGRPRGFGSFAARRPLALAAASAVLFALLGGVIGAVTASSSRAESPPVLAFSPATGWNTLQTRDASNPGIEFAWAANVPFSRNDAVTGEPVETVKSLPADGVAIYASTLPQVSEDAAYREAKLPLRLSDGTFLSGQYENQPAPNVSTVMVNARVNGRYVFAQVYFGTPEPSADLRRVADVELGRLFVPAGP